MDVQQRIVRSLYVEAALYGLATGVPQLFLAVFALRLGAPSQAIGLLTALPSLINALLLIPSARLIERQHTARTPLMVSFLFQGTQYAAIAAVPLVASPWQTPLLLVIIALGAIPSGLYTVLINDVMATVTPPQHRGRVLGNRQMLITLADAFVVFAGGWFLTLLPLPVNYQLLFLIVFGISLVNLGVLHHMGVPRAGGDAERPAQSVFSLDQVRRLMTDQGQGGVFLRFVVAAFALLFSGWLPRPLFSIYWVRQVGASDAWIGFLTMTSNLISACGFLVWGRLVHRLGNRRLLLIGSLGYVAYPILTALAPSPEFLLIPVISGALMFPPYTLGLMNGVLELAPAERRANYVAVYTAVSNLASFAAPILSTALILPLVGIHLALLIGSAARFLGFLAVCVLVQKPTRGGVA